MKWITRLFFFIEGFLYISFLSIDFGWINRNDSSLLKYLAILGCFLYVSFFTIKKENKEKKPWLLVTALAGTVIADFFLLFTELFAIGISFFIGVQTVYCRYLTEKYQKVVYKLLLNGLITGIIFVILRTFSIEPDSTLLLSIFYFLTLLHNTFDSIKHAVRMKHAGTVLFAMGMVFFLLCDIQVGIYNFSSYFIVSGIVMQALYQIASVAMWFFYLPSQVLLTQSVRYYKKNNP